MRLLLYLYCFLLCIHAPAQEYAKWIELAEEAKLEEDFQGAVSYYSKAFALDSARAELQYALAEAHQANHQYRDALRYYQRVYRKDRGRFYPDGPFHIAEMHMFLGNYEEALDYWKRANTLTYLDEKKRADIMQGIRSCDFALLHPEEQEGWNIQDLGPRVNSPEADFAAYILPDSTLLFSSLRGPYNAEFELQDPGRYTVHSFQSIWSGEAWKKTSVISSSFFNAEANYVNPALSPDGVFLYISQCDDLHKCKLGRFPWNDSIIGPIELLPAEVNVESGTHTHPYPILYEGKELLFFSSDRAGTIGGMDIWLALKNDDQWQVNNLGPVVNSSGNEVTPAYDMATNELYFSSDSYPGYGGFDVFKVKGTPHVFSGDVENMGLPLNSSYNDLYFRWQGNWGVLSSNRATAQSIDGSQCCNDLFLATRTKSIEKEIQETDSLVSAVSVTVPESISNVSELKNLLPLSLYFHNDIPDPGSRATLTSLNYQSTLEAYLGMRETYKEEYKKGLSPAQSTNAVALMDEFFNEELAAHLAMLDDVTALLLGELKKGKSIEIAIKGFASPLAQSDYNKLLTERRISSVINYFSAFQNGALLPYLNGKSDDTKLIIKKIPFGEEKAEKMVSDNPQDRQNSVFSISAAKERRVEILRISEVEGG